MQFSKSRFFFIVLVCITSLISTVYIFKSQAFDFHWKETRPKICQIDANCNTFHICLSGKCQRFFPAQPSTHTKCHRDCVDDLTLYEEKYYRQAIGNVVFLKGVDTSNCLIAYKQIGLRFSYINDTYPKYNLERIERREELKGWVLGLCRGI